MSAIVTVTGLAKRFANRTLYENVGFDVQTGDIIFITGESGVGKTTLINMLIGLTKPDAGQITLENNGQKTFGVVPQDYGVLDDMSVAGNLNIATPFWKRTQRVQLLAALKQVGLTNIQLKKSAMYLSGGEKQRLSLARLLILDRPVFVLDEPTSNLDDKNTQILKQTLVKLARQGKAIIVISHDARMYEIGNKRLHIENKVVAVSHLSEKRLTVNS